VTGRRPASLIIILTACTLWPLAAVADERILGYHSDITVEEDGSMTVQETIRVRAEGRMIRRGIFRDFPTDYRDRFGNRYRVGFEVTAVTRDGLTEPWKAEDYANGVRVYAGHPDVYLDPGEYTYRISYRTNRQLGFFEDHDELYWNVTGNGWDLPIDVASAVVRLPREIPAGSLDAAAYTGIVGNTARNAATEVSDGQAIIETTRAMRPREGLTVVVSWPKGIVQEPTFVQRFRWMLRDNRGLLIALACFGLLFTYLYVAWSRFGRDPAEGVVFPHYDPPEDISPATARFVRRMRYDDRVFTAAIINLAVNGHLEISESGSDYTVTRKNKEPAPAPPGERVLLAKLFSKGSVVELDDKNHKVIGGARRAHRRALRLHNHKVYFRLNSNLLIPAVIILIVAALIIVSVKGLTIASGIALGADVTLIAVFNHLMKAATPHGRKLMDRLEGFRLYMDVAERDDLELRNPPEKTPELFERYLPFALALDVEQAWAEQFADVFAGLGDRAEYRPRWYHGEFSPDRLSSFTSDVGSSLTSAIASSATPPGSSSGSGGGGFSGGGGGGGGGGGW
jgi:uncharacterized membrane protein YgcG